QEPTQLTSSLPVLLDAWKHSQGTSADRFLLSTASPLKPVYLEAGRLEPDYKNSHALRAARNEFESVQVQVVPFAGDLKDVRWTLSPLTNKDGGKIGGKVFVVAYVLCEETVYTPGNKAGWHPDGLADFADHIAHVPMGEILNLWVRVYAPADAAPGDYSGTLTVTAANAAPQVLNITTRVNTFALPVEPNEQTINSLIANFDGMGKFYPADKIPKILERTEDMLLDDYRMNVGNIICSPATEPFHWDATRLRALKAKGLQRFPIVSMDWYPGTPEQMANAAIADIQKIMPEVEKAGLRDQAIVYGFDEWPPEKFGKALDIIRRLKAVYPDLKVLTCALSYWGLKGAETEEARIVDIWAPLISLFDENPGLIQRLQARGTKVGWYICQFPGPPYPGIMVEQPPADMRLLLGAMAHKYKSDGFLYWAFNQWVLNSEPISSLPRCEFNPNTYNGPERYNGGGHLLLPGPNGPIPTVRLESMRDGLDDNDYYVILERLLKQKGLPPDAANVPKSVVENLTRFTVDPSVIEAERSRVADEIERVSALPDISSAAAP
ncbi:MAG: glycoside hydrolase domain-containing protein, partial [Verrucomicrobiota bacterium]